MCVSNEELGWIKGTLTCETVRQCDSKILVYHLLGLSATLPTAPLAEIGPCASPLGFPA